MSRRWRAFLPGLPADADPGREVELARDESHHLVTVLRLAPGATIGVFDGRGVEWSAELVAADRRRATARLVTRVDEPVESPLVWRLFQGSCRPDRMDWVVQKATELGATAVTAVGPGSRVGDARAERRRRRWRRIAVEAAKQSGRRVVPDVGVADDWPRPAAEVVALLCDPRPAAPPLADRLRGSAPRELWIAVGPEDGFSDDLADDLAAAGWRIAGLGPRVLRTETAGPVAAAIALHRWGDLGAAAG